MVCLSILCVCGGNACERVRGVCVCVCVCWLQCMYVWIKFFFVQGLLSGVTQRETEAEGPAAPSDATSSHKEAAVVLETRSCQTESLEEGT